MRQLLSELHAGSGPATLQLLRSEMKSTDVVREYLERTAAEVGCVVRCFDIAEGDQQDQAIIEALVAGMSEGVWIYVANITPSQDQLLRKLALLALTSDVGKVHQDFRLWLSTLTIHTSFEAPPIHSGKALPRVLLHLCNAPQSLLGDMDTMRIVEKHTPDTARYDSDGFDAAMADIAEKLCLNDPATTCLRYEDQRGLSGEVFFLMLPDAFKHNTHLECLDLVGCGIGDEGASKLGKSLKTNKGLRTINLDRNQLSDEALRSICDGLAQNKTLATLSISHNTGISGDGLLYLGSALTKCSLQQLLMSHNNSLSQDQAWGRSAVQALWEGVGKSRLNTLDVVGCELSSWAAACLAFNLVGNKYMRMLHISCNRIGDVGAVAFARIIRDGDCALESLHLDDCCVGINTFISLGVALKETTVLRELMLARSMPGSIAGYHSLKEDSEEKEAPTAPLEMVADEPHVFGDKKDAESSKGMRHLSAGLQVNNSLVALSLGCCQLTDDLVYDICEALLVHNNTLTEIDLSGNPSIGDVGARRIQALMRGSRSLKIVDTSCNSDQLGERAVLALNTSAVEELYLRDVGITDGVALSMRDSIAANGACRLRVVDLSDNLLFKEGLARVGDILKSCTTIEVMRLNGNLKKAHEDTSAPLHERGTRSEGLSRFKDDGIEEVRPFMVSLAELPSESSLKYLDLQDNTLNDTCLHFLLSCVEHVPLQLEINISGNHHTSSIIPVVDGFAAKETTVTITIDEP